MKMVRNNTLYFREIPDGPPVPGKTLKLEAEQIDMDNYDQLQPGSVLVKTQWLSIDPYMRGLMRDPSVPSYMPAYPLNQPIAAGGIAEVVFSRNEKLSPGDHITGLIKFAEYQVLDEAALKRCKKVEKSGELKWSTFLGAAGMPGMTAWYGISKIAKPKKGETIYISGAAGAVGQVVAQLCKRAGCKIIGSAGSDDKVDFLKKELGFDVAFNYKTTDTLEVLKEHKFEMYWDNVQGPQLDAVLQTIEKHGRIVCCGAISGYNGEQYGMKHMDQFLKKSLYMQGFILGTIDPKETTGFYEEVVPLVAKGEIKLSEKIWKGLDNGEAFLGMLQGENTGKALIQLE